MDIILIYHKGREGHQFAYNPKTNNGMCCNYSPLKYVEERLSVVHNGTAYNDIHSYMRFAEELNKYASGTLFIEEPLTQSYEYW